MQSYTFACISMLHTLCGKIGKSLHEAAPNTCSFGLRPLVEPVLHISIPFTPFPVLHGRMSVGAEPRRRRPAAAPRRRRSSRPQPTTRAGRRAARSGAEPPRGPPLLAPCAAHLAASRRASTPEARRSRRPTPSHSRPETMSHLRRPSCSAVDPAARHSPYHVMLPPCARPSCAPLTSPVPPRFLLLAGWPEARFLASSGLEAQTRAPRGEKSRSSQDQGARWRPEVTKSGFFCNQSKHELYGRVIRRVRLRVRHREIAQTFTPRYIKPVVYP